MENKLWWMDSSEKLIRNNGYWLAAKTYFDQCPDFFDQYGHCFRLMRWRFVSVFVAIVDAKLPSGATGQQDGGKADSGEIQKRKAKDNW